MNKLSFLFFVVLFSFFKTPLMANGLDSLLNLLSANSTLNSEEGLDQKSILCNDIAVRYQDLEDDNKARVYFMQALEFTKQRIEKQGVWDAQNNYDMACLYQNLGVFESTTGNVNQADVYMSKAEFYYRRLESQIPADEYVELILLFYQSNFARAYHAQSYLEAEKYMEDIELLLERHHITKSAELSRLTGELYSAQSRNEEALIFMQEALDQLDRNSSVSDSPGHNIIHSYLAVLFYLKRDVEIFEFLNQRESYRTFEEAEEVGMKEDVVEIEDFLNNLFIRSYALIKYGALTNDISYTKEAFEWQKLAFRLAENNILKNRADKLEGSVSTAKNKVMAFLKCALILRENEALNSDAILELMRIIDLYQSARLHLERISYETNRETWEKQKKINAEIDYVTLKLEELSNQSTNQPLEDSLRNRSYELSLALNALQMVSKQDKILDEYRIGQDGFTEMLTSFVDKKNATLLTYFYEKGNDSLYILGCNKSDNFLFGIAVPENLNDEILELYELNGNLLYAQSDLDRQKQLNQLFYQRLIQPVLPYLSSSQIIIYPIDELGYISFDALQSPTNRYLIEDYSISYTTSLFSLCLTKKRETHKNNFSAFYPANYGTDSLAFLFNAKAEIDQINAELKGKLYEGNAATKAKFLSVVNESAILHIASHSLLNVEHPYESAIVFDAENEQNENRLYAYEIFSKTINAEMVILSSCNSAHGEIEEGIGVVSLSNAFFYAGTPSTISSLWSAQDLSSSEIMIGFYKQLKLGKTKSESLRTAKIGYLEKADKLKRQPFFWANYVVYGADDPLFEQEEISWLSYFIGVLAIPVLCFVSIRFVKLSKIKARI